MTTNASALRIVWALFVFVCVCMCMDGCAFGIAIISHLTMHKLTSMVKHINKYALHIKSHLNNLLSHRYDRVNNFQPETILQKRRANRLTYKRYSHHKFGSAGTVDKSIIRVAAAETQYPPAPKIPSTTINPIYEYSEEKVAIAEHDFHRRRDHLWKMCAKYDFIDRYPPNAWEFFISSGHGVAWCNVFKAASSTMMFYFNILGKH